MDRTVFKVPVAKATHESTSHDSASLFPNVCSAIDVKAGSERFGEGPRLKVSRPKQSRFHSRLPTAPLLAALLLSCSPGHLATASACQKRLQSVSKPPTNSTALSFTTASRLVKGPFSGLQSNTSGSCSKRRPVDRQRRIARAKAWMDGHAKLVRAYQFAGNGSAQ